MGGFANTAMIRLLFLIRSLNAGGAERQLVELVKALDKEQFSITVASFYNGGELRDELISVDGIELVSLKRKGRWDLLPFLTRLFKLVWKKRPQLIYGFSPVCNELALIFGRIVGAKVVFGIRTSNMDLSKYDWASKLVAQIAVFSSYLPDLIITNSFAGKNHYEKQGYNSSCMVVIPNGINTEQFYPNLYTREQQREYWKVTNQEYLVGVVGRLDPMKDHETFFKAAAILIKWFPNVKFVCVGDGPIAYKTFLQQQANQLNLNNYLIWAGACIDMLTVYNALDIVVSSSYGEGFSNVIGEAMACGIPCVVTGVGDSTLIVGDTGLIVPPKNPEALAKGVSSMLQKMNSLNRDYIRKRIVTEFSTQKLAVTTAKMLLKTL